MKAVLKIIAPLFVLVTAMATQAAPKFIGSDSKTGTSLAVVSENVPLAHTTQILPLNKNGQIVGKGDSAKQIEQTLKNLSRVLSDADSSLDRVVKINICAAQIDVVSEVEKLFAKKFKNTFKPAITFVVGKLSHPDALVAMDAVAQCKTSPRAKPLNAVTPEDGAQFLSASILPTGGVVYISGQAKPGELAEATTKTLESLQETLSFLSLKKTDVVQIKCFIDPASDAEIAKRQIAAFYSGAPVPPLIFVDWISPKLPIEIEMIVVAPANRATKESVSYITPPEFKPSNVYSKVTRVNFGRLVYVSGLYGKTADDPEQQILEMFGSLKQTIEEAGSDFDSLAKATYYVADARSSAQLNALRPRFYNPARPPAASKAMVRGVGRPNKIVTFDMIAVSPK